jgi:hypothetical protein
MRYPCYFYREAFGQVALIPLILFVPWGVMGISALLQAGGEASFSQKPSGFQWLSPVDRLGKMCVALLDALISR